MALNDSFEFNLTYHVRGSQRGREDQWGVFEQFSGSGGWYIEIQTFDTKGEAELSAERFSESVAAAVEAQRQAAAERIPQFPCEHCGGTGQCAW